jgi:hypothetical protein
MDIHSHMPIPFELSVRQWLTGCPCEHSRPDALVALIVAYARWHGSQHHVYNHHLCLIRPAGLPLSAPALPEMLGLASVCIHTSAALDHPGRNSPVPASEWPSVLLRSRNSQYAHSIVGFILFSLFGNLILARADRSFSSSQHCQTILYWAITCEKVLNLCTLQTFFLSSSQLGMKRR